MFRCSLKDGVSRTNQIAQIAEQSLEIGLNRLQQLGDGDHETPRRRDPSGLSFRIAALQAGRVDVLRARGSPASRTHPDQP